jgi:phage gpG-like protein
VADTIQVHGLRDLRRALRDIEKTLPRELAAGLAEAADIVTKGARPKVPVRTGRAAASIKVRKSQRAAIIAVGGTKAPYFPWLDFGGKVGRGKSVARPFISGGRYIYPTLKDKDREVKDKIDEVLKRLAVKAGFETHGDAAR